MNENIELCKEFKMTPLGKWCKLEHSFVTKHHCQMCKQYKMKSRQTRLIK